MIRLLQGTLHSKDERSAILLVNGVGYLVFVPNTFDAALQTELTLFIHTHVREDTLALYGFASKEELAFFELLLTVSGIGPKMALEIICQPVASIQNAILTGNLATLTKISGVGKKLAERLVLELKGKVVPSDLSQINSSASSATGISGVDEDAIAALESLGYKRHHIQKVFESVPDTHTKTTEEIIRYFLQKA